MVFIDVYFSLQLPQYQSSASVFQPCTLGSPSLASSHINSKVSAWLQQTQRADACQQGLLLFLFTLKTPHTIFTRLIIRCLLKSSAWFFLVSLNVAFWPLTPAELARCQLDLAELGRLIKMLHCLEGDLPISNMDLEKRISMQVSEGAGLMLTSHTACKAGLFYTVTYTMCVISVCLC